MEIVLSLQQEQVERYIQRGGSPLFEVFWKFPGLDYPMPGWTDFGLVLIGWWLLAVIRLAEGNSVEDFFFMDGPYKIRAEYSRNTGLVTLNPDGLTQTWSISYQDLARELIRVANKASNYLIAADIAETQRLSIDQTVRRLRNILKDI